MQRVTWPRLSRGGWKRWEARLQRLHPRVAVACGHPVCVLKPVPRKADVVRETRSGETFTWIELDIDWLFHRARMHGEGFAAQRAVAAYALGTLTLRASGVHLPDALIGRALQQLNLPIEPAQAFAASLGPLDPLQVPTDPQVRVAGLQLGYAV